MLAKPANSLAVSIYHPLHKRIPQPDEEGLVHLYDNGVWTYLVRLPTGGLLAWNDFPLAPSA
jgi:hypothetical protein